jgi:DNA-binding response OmpR family regulator
MSEGGGSARANVLIVDSHADDRERLRAQLASVPFDVLVASNGREARQRLTTSRIDAVVVDPDLPDGDGFDLVRGLTVSPNRVVFVVASGEDDGLADHAYASGATDFAYKPIARNELLARLRKKIEDRVIGEAPPRLALRAEDRTCLVDGREYALTRNERAFLACLLDAPRNFATYVELIRAVWGEAQGVETQSLRVLAAQVRRKIERPDARPLIHTVVGEGFKLNL